MDLTKIDTSTTQAGADVFAENKSSILVGTIVLTAVAIPTYFLCREYSNSLYRYNSMVNRNFGNDPDVKKFLTTFLPPEDQLLSLIKEQNSWPSAEQAKFRNNPQSYNEKSFPSDKNVYLKTDYVVSRVICARRLREFVQEKGYTTVSAPDKYLLLSNDGKYLLCAAKKITPTIRKEITIDLKQMQEFSDTVTTTRFCDWNSGNFMIDQYARIVFIDTEMRSFSHGERSKDYNINQLKNFILLDSNDKVEMNGVSIKVTKEAKDYLLQQISDHRTANQTSSTSFTQMNRLDNGNLKLTKIHPLINNWGFEKNNGCKREAEEYDHKYIA